MPSSLYYLALFLPALLALPSPGSYSGDTDFSETSGGELQNEVHAQDEKGVYIARQLYHELASARDEQIKSDFATDDMKQFEGQRNKIKMPHLGISDGCFPSGFHGQKCLRQIYSGLQLYHHYLKYVEQERRSGPNIEDIKYKTSSLIDLIKNTLQLGGKDQPIDLTQVTAFTVTAWNQRIFTHSVLYNFTNFMIVTSRVLDHLDKTEDKKSFLKHQQ